jgi:hypothetical protein
MQMNPWTAPNLRKKIIKIKSDSTFFKEVVRTEQCLKFAII